MSLSRRLAWIASAAAAAVILQSCTTPPKHLWRRQILAADRNLEGARFEASEGHLKKALEYAEASQKPLVLVPATLDRLCSLYISMGRDVAAEDACRRSLEIREAQLGPDHLDLTLSLTRLVELLMWQGRFAEAEDAYLRVLRIRESSLGPDHPLVALALCNFARAETLRSDYGRAEELFLRCIDIRTRSLGPDHPEVGKALLGYAELLYAVGRDQEALDLRFRGKSLDRH